VVQTPPNEASRIEDALQRQDYSTGELFRAAPGTCAVLQFAFKQLLPRFDDLLILDQEKLRTCSVVLRAIVS
jgi:hypothetical protein